MSSAFRNSHSAGSSSSGDSRKRERPKSNSRSRNPRNVLRSKNSPFTDFGSYMAEKNRKLRDQFETDASTSSTGAGNDGKGIFNGVSIFVDGFTTPSNQELKGYMLKYGGRFMNYFSRHTVTHIICSNLPDSKMKNLRAFSRGLPVVKPAWVVDSVATNRLLSWVPYGLSDYVKESCKQQKLYSFFYQKSDPSLDHVEMTVTPDSDSDNEGTFSNDKVAKQSMASEQPQKFTYEGENSEEFACFEHGSTDQRKTMDSNDTDSQAKQSVLDASESSCRYSGIHSTENPNSKEALDIKSVKDSNVGHSTLTDPNFVENYFKAMTKILGVTNSRDAWLALETYFSNKSKAREIQWKNMSFKCFEKGHTRFLSMFTFLEMHAINSAIGCTIPQTDKVHMFLRGLSVNFATFQPQRWDKSLFQASLIWYKKLLVMIYLFVLLIFTLQHHQCSLLITAPLGRHHMTSLSPNTSKRTSNLNKTYLLLLVRSAREVAIMLASAGNGPRRRHPKPPLWKLFPLVPYKINMTLNVPSPLPHMVLLCRIC